jgi:hypothetical protein
MRREYRARSGRQLRYGHVRARRQADQRNLDSVLIIDVDR